MKVAIYGSKRQGNYLSRIVRMLTAMHESGMEIIMHSKLYRHLSSEVPGTLPVDKVVSDDRFEADMAVSLGGDGTFLRTARWVGSKPIPVVGVNTGHLGYLAAYNIDEVCQLVDDLLSQNYMIENRTLLMVDSPATPEGEFPCALNEVAILRTEHASMITCQVSIGGAAPACYQADGLIVSTPTGSTGYNLSVGGPIVEPTAPVWVISPIAAHSLTMRPLIVSDSNDIAIMISARTPTFLLSLDGNSFTLPVGTQIRLRKSPFVTMVIHKRDHQFIGTLRNKLLWGV
ncbi:MAG: NAD(+)/NADH kinase [Muribaculaceae bacterium]|nr:NAD(+)/NADH kinase [Muribaculaceae bacterium]